MVFCMVCFFYMTIVNSREDILKHENPEYIKSRPKWELGQGRIPDLSDYRKLSVDSMEEAMTLARIGQIIGQQFIPTIQNKPFRTYFTQALILGASLITRSMAEKYNLDFEKYRSVLLVCPSRYGKGFGHSVKIMTKDGWKKHGELQVGDYVFHPDGHLVKVVAKSEPFKCVYRITFQNGSTFETSAEHEWYVWNKRKSNGRGNPQGGYELLETQAMEGKVLYNDPKGPRSRYFVEPPQPCQFDKKEQPLDPYFFGCWLGDGTSKYPWLTLNSQKAEHILPHIPYKVINSYPQIGCTRYVFSRQGIVGYLHSLKVFGDKHIPDCYKYSSPEQQKALLAGIIDTDGSVDRNGRVIISCANERLAKDLLELLTIMGECPYETVVPATMSSSGVVGKHDVHMIGYQPAYDLPTKFKRLPRFIPHHRIGITKIEKVEHGEPGNCIQVDSPDGLYLVGEKLIPTHNSFINGASILIHAGANGEEVQIGAATMPKAEIIQAKAVEMLPWTCEKLQEGLIVDGQEEDRFKKIKRLSTKVSKDNLRWTNGGSIGMFSTNETKKNADVSAAGAIGIGGDFCIDGENKVLTRHGWVRLADLSDGEAVAQYTDDGKIEFVVPSRVIRKHYKGNGYIFTPPGTEDKIFMIPEHRQPLMNLDGEIVIREAKDLRLYNYWSVIMAGEGTGPNKLSAVDRLAIACQADGCILKTTEKGNYFQLKVKKERKARRLEVLFDEANMPVRIHQDKRGYYVCHFYMPITCNKHLPDWFGYEFGADKARAILDEIVEWDGYIYPDGTLYYSSKIRENTEWVQAVATQAGYRSKVSVQHDSRKATFSDIHRIHIKKISTRSCDYAKMEETSWDDMVYCVTVPSGMFLIKNKKSTIITGNCVFDEVQLMTPVGFRTASRFLVESPDTKRFCVGNPMINGHFKELYDNPSTFVVHINEVTCIIEERMTRRGIELTGMPTYSEEYRAFVCVDDETECLTPDGWTSIKDVGEGDIIAQIGEGETIEFVPVKHKIKTTSPTILKTSFAHDEWLFTPDHRQYVYNTSKRTKKVAKRVYKVKDLPKGSNVRIMAGGNNPKNQCMTILDQLAIIVQADGTRETEYQGKFVNKPKGLTKWRIELRKERKVARLRGILDKGKIPYKELLQKDGDIRFTFAIPSKITKKLPDYFGWEIGGELAQEILEEILFWDGCLTNGVYNSVVKENVDWVQAVAAQCSVRTYTSQEKMWNGNTIYKVKLYNNNVRTTQHMVREEVSWNKPVYCVTVPSGEWLARRHGHVINTGNCTEFPDERSGTRFFTTLPEIWDPAKLPTPIRKFYFLGIDSAYKGGDSLMMSLVSFNEGGGKKWFALEKQEDLKKRFGGNWDANTTLDISLDILKTWEKYNVAAGCIDIGFGIHIYEKLRDLDPSLPLEPINYASKPTEWRQEQDYNAKFALNKRAELHLDLRDLASNDLLYICADSYDEVRREMGEVAQAPAKQKIQIEPKKDIKARLGRSPDAMDSLCLGIHAAVLSGVLNGTNELQDEDIMEIIS